MRIYHPPECADDMKPLDWDECRTCRGNPGTIWVQTHACPCPTCDGHGSLKAAALEAARDHSIKCLMKPVGVCICGPPRCEDCGHPMSDPTWEGGGGVTPNVARTLCDLAFLHLKRGIASDFPTAATHYSPCDEGCRHDAADLDEALSGEASWRPVDVRTLSYPNILTPDQLAVLCLRCWAARCARMEP